VADVKSLAANKPAPARSDKTGVVDRSAVPEGLTSPHLSDEGTVALQLLLSTLSPTKRNLSAEA
jgi:hypothetical protein